jgi:hypothetical protein
MKREVFRDLVACQSEFAVLGLAPGLALRPRRAAYGLAGLGYRQGAALHAGRIQAPVQSVSIAGNVFCGAGSSLAVERGEALGRGAENSTVARLGASKGQQIFKGYIWLIFLFSLSVSGEALSSDAWSAGDTQRELAYQEVEASDWQQTHYIATTPGHQESNTLLGIHPSADKIDAYFFICGALHYAISRSLPAEYRSAWQYISIGFEGAVVAHNLSFGVKVEHNLSLRVKIDLP